MHNEYLVSIIGTQIVDGEADNIEVLTTCDYVSENGDIYIKYKEYDSDSPDQFVSSVVKIEGENKVTIVHSGDRPSQLMLEKGRRHHCHYKTIMGDLLIGVFTDSIKSSLTDKGGNLWVKYTLDFNSGLVSQNEFKLNIKKKIKGASYVGDCN